MLRLYHVLYRLAWIICNEAKDMPAALWKSEDVSIHWVDQVVRADQAFIPHAQAIANRLQRHCANQEGHSCLYLLFQF